MKAPLGINRITPSMLMDYENCPKSFYYKSWLGLKLPTPQIHLQFGTAIHAAIDEIYEQQPRWSTGEFQKAVDIFQSKFLPYHVDDKPYTEVERNLKYHEMVGDGIEMLRQFWSQKEILWAEGVRPVNMELVLKMPVFNPQTKEPLEVPVSGRLDGETAEGHVIEFKTSAQEYDNFVTHLSPQARMYVWMQYCRTGKIPHVHYVVLVKKRKRDKVQHLHLQFDMADMLAFDENVRTVLEKIRNREFNRGRNCPPYCDCKKIDALLSKNN